MTLFGSLLALPLAVDRLDTWVLWGGVGFVLVCVVGLGFWHLATYLIGKLPKKHRTVRHSPEPPSPIQSPKPPPRVGGLADAAPNKDDPDRLQEACTALEDSLAKKYLELAEIWLQRGQPQKAAAALKKVLQICPEGHWAQAIQTRLQQIGSEVPDQGS